MTICAMPATLVDTNIWLAAVFATHPGHAVASHALRVASTGSTGAVLPRHRTELSAAADHARPAARLRCTGQSNREALLTLKALQGLPAVRFADEPPGTVARWHALAARDTASPKLWMDAYLAAFALAGGLGLVTMDTDFRQSGPQGLEACVLFVG